MRTSCEQTTRNLCRYFSTAFIVADITGLIVDATLGEQPSNSGSVNSL